MTSPVLPTHTEMLLMKEDCGYDECRRTAEKWKGLCSHPLIVVHQKIISASIFQLVMRHGDNGEAVFITEWMLGIDKFPVARVVEWLRSIHEYEMRGVVIESETAR